MCAEQKILNNALKDILLIRRIEADICFRISSKPLVHYYYERIREVSNYITHVIIETNTELNHSENICSRLKPLWQAIVSFYTLCSVILILVAPNDFYCEI